MQPIEVATGSFAAAGGVCYESSVTDNITRNCTGDEGRPLVIILQELVTNQGVLLPAKSGGGERHLKRQKVICQVSIKEMTARESLTTHRNVANRCQNRILPPCLG